jgi:hypothetical protein
MGKTKRSGQKEASSELKTVRSGKKSTPAMNKRSEQPHYLQNMETENSQIFDPRKKITGY